MNITPVNLFNIRSFNKAIQKQTPCFVKNNCMDSVSFSGKRHTKDCNEVLHDADCLKEEMEDCYAAEQTEGTPYGYGVKTYMEDYNTGETYITLDDEKDINGAVTSKNAVFKNGILQEIVVFKTKQNKETEKETYYFDTEIGTLKRYVLELTNDCSNKNQQSCANTTKIEYEFTI